MVEELQELGGGFVESKLLVTGPEFEGIAVALTVEATKDVAGEVYAEATLAAVGSVPTEGAWAAVLVAALLG